MEQTGRSEVAITHDLITLTKHLEVVEKVGVGNKAIYRLTEQAGDYYVPIQFILSRLWSRPTREQLEVAKNQIDRVYKNWRSIGLTLFYTFIANEKGLPNATLKERLIDKGIKEDSHKAGCDYF